MMGKYNLNLNLNSASHWNAITEEKTNKHYSQADEVVGLGLGLKKLPPFTIELFFFP